MVISYRPPRTKTKPLRAFANLCCPARDKPTATSDFERSRSLGGRLIMEVPVATSTPSSARNRRNRVNLVAGTGSILFVEEYPCSAPWAGQVRMPHIHRFLACFERSKFNLQVPTNSKCPIRASLAGSRSQPAVESVHWFLRLELHSACQSISLRLCAIDLPTVEQRCRINILRIHQHGQPFGRR